MATLVAVMGVAVGCASRTETAPPKDMRVLRPGVTRTEILEKFGRPLSTTTSKKGTLVDIFRFVQTTTSAGDVPQPIEPGEEDAQIVKIMMAQTGVMPEKMLDGKMLTVQVNYDANNVVADTYLLAMKK